MMSTAAKTRRHWWQCILAVVTVGCTTVGGGLSAQETAIKATQQKLAVLPGKVHNVSMVDDQLYCYASNVLLVAQRNGEQLMGFWPDTLYVNLVESANYVVKQPLTGDVYLTKCDKRGRSQLYRVHYDHRSRPKVSKMKMEGLCVEHPVFTSDGNIMIFAARGGKDSRGGYDIWYARCSNGKWGRPINMGDRINTRYDELSPSIYGDCMIFASSGQGGDVHALNLYATSLTSPNANDNAGEVAIGRNVVQQLPTPINCEGADDFDMVVDSLGKYGYWVSRRKTGDSDSQLYSFVGGLDGVMLWGRVTDWHNEVMPNVNIQVSQNGAVICRTQTDADGGYQVFLPSGQYYDIAYQKDGYFVEFEVVNTFKKTGSQLITEDHRDVTLNGLVHNKEIYYDDLFGPGADLELSEYGTEKLAPLVRYLTDNPNSRMRLTLVSDITDDAGFNLMLSSQRLQTIETYLYTQLPPTVQIDFINGCAGRNGCSSGSGKVRLTAIIEPHRP